MSYPPPPDQSGQGGFQYDPYGNQPGSQPPGPQSGGYSPQQPGYAAQQPGYGQPQQPYAQPGMAPAMAPQYGGMPPQQLPKGLAIASMVLGIVGAALFCIPFVNFVCAILAAIMGGIGLKKANAGQAGGKGMAITGLVLGIIVCSWFALWIIMWISGAVSMGVTGATM
ncbi:DUF4190 domain-containing protein [Glycomyces tarimensis]